MCRVPCAVRHVPFAMRSASCAMCCVPCAMRRASCAMCCVPCAVCHAPCVMCHVLCAMRRVPCAAGMDDTCVGRGCIPHSGGRQLPRGQGLSSTIVGFPRECLRGQALSEGSSRQGRRAAAGRAGGQRRVGPEGQNAGAKMRRTVVSRRTRDTIASGNYEV